MGAVQVELEQDLVDLLEELHRPVKQAARELIVSNSIAREKYRVGRRRSCSAWGASSSFDRPPNGAFHTSSSMARSCSGSLTQARSSEWPSSQIPARSSRSPGFNDSTYCPPSSNRSSFRRLWLVRLRLRSRSSRPGCEYRRRASCHRCFCWTAPGRRREGGAGARHRAQGRLDHPRRPSGQALGGGSRPECDWHSRYCCSQRSARACSRRFVQNSTHLCARRSSSVRSSMMNIAHRRRSWGLTDFDMKLAAETVAAGLLGAESEAVGVDVRHVPLPLPQRSLP